MNVFYLLSLILLSSCQYSEDLDEQITVMSGVSATAAT